MEQEDAEGAENLGFILCTLCVLLFKSNNCWVRAWCGLVALFS